jgi:hypothetical protein
MTPNLPVILFDEDEAINTVSRWFEAIQHKMTAQYSREYLEAALRDLLQRGLIETLKVIEWADGGDVIADAALRRLYAEMSNRHEEPPVVLKAYIIKTLVSGPVKRGRGHYWFDDWRRNIGIAILVHLTSERFNLPITLNPEQRRRGQPSAPGIVAAALGRYHVNMASKTVENIAAPRQADVLASPWLPLLQLVP